MTSATDHVLVFRYVQLSTISISTRKPGKSTILCCPIWPMTSTSRVIRAWTGGCFTNVSRAPQNILAKIHNTRNHIYCENFNLKICTCAHVQSFSLKFSSQVLFVQYTNFERIVWRARERLVKQPPGLRRYRERFCATVRDCMLIINHM